jgi:hypothetical protein
LFSGFPFTKKKEMIIKKDKFKNIFKGLDIVAGGAALILTNITLITLASLKVFGIINYP